MKNDWIKTKGREPQRKVPYFIRYRNGRESKQAYTAEQQQKMQWGHHRKGMDDDWDIVAVRKE